MPYLRTCTRNLRREVTSLLRVQFLHGGHCKLVQDWCHSSKAAVGYAAELGERLGERQRLGEDREMLHERSVNKLGHLSISSMPELTQVQNWHIGIKADDNQDGLQGPVTVLKRADTGLEEDPRDRCAISTHTQLEDSDDTDVLKTLEVCCFKGFGKALGEICLPVPQYKSLKGVTQPLCVACKHRTEGICGLGRLWRYCREGHELLPSRKGAMQSKCFACEHRNENTLVSRRFWRYCRGRRYSLQGMITRTLDRGAQRTDEEDKLRLRRTKARRHIQHGNQRWSSQRGESGWVKWGGGQRKKGEKLARNQGETMKHIPVQRVPGIRFRGHRVGSAGQIELARARRWPSDLNLTQYYAMGVGKLVGLEPDTRAAGLGLQQLQQDRGVW
ncbi:hypothetical protein B0H10DRAFT_1969034 [Mycena sp. CBHHK59/15]|nr:hypothetical protein B0H10DRAFT_1969034 [Mycena sp. CBHHK59/15]